MAISTRAPNHIEAKADQNARRLGHAFSSAFGEQAIDRLLLNGREESAPIFPCPSPAPGCMS
jgi:hypothetical protein